MTTEAVGTTSYDGFHVEREPERGTATITLDVPEKLNRVSMLARDQLAQVLGELGGEEGVRVILIGGAGERAFTAGGDIAGFLERHPEVVSRLAENVGAPERCPKPVIAKLHGFTFGVGLELALACDFRIAAEDVQLALPEVTLGQIPGSGGSQRVARLAGLGRAKDMVMRGRRIGAEEALAWGLVTEVVPPERLEQAAADLADELAGRSALALGMAKRVLNHAYDGPLSLGVEIEGLAYGLLRSTHDFAEGVQAFTEKRPARFEDR